MKVATIAFPCGIPGVVVRVTKELTHGSGLDRKPIGLGTRGLASIDRFVMPSPPTCVSSVIGLRHDEVAHSNYCQGSVFISGACTRSIRLDGTGRIRAVAAGRGPSHLVTIGLVQPRQVWSNLAGASGTSRRKVTTVLSRLVGQSRFVQPYYVHAL